jgi:hypothetical protein
MKRHQFILFILLFPSVLQSQIKIEVKNPDLSRTVHVRGDASVSVSPNVLFNTPNGTQFAGGLKLRMFLGKKFSFDSDLVLGKDYAHFGIGLIGLPAWFFFSRPDLKFSEDQSFSEVIIIGILMIASAEHAAYHIPLRNKTDLSPYMSVLRFKSTKNRTIPNSPDSDIDQAGFAAGIEVNKYFKRFVVSPYIEYSIGYADHLSGINTGVYCGYCFLSK